LADPVGCIEINLAFTATRLQTALQVRAQTLALDYLAAGAVTAQQITSKRQELPEELRLPLSTSLKSLDDLLDGGFLLHQLVEISGSIAKTLLALNVCLRLLLLDATARVLYIDVEATFNPQRAFAVLRHLADAEPATAGQRDAELVKVMDRLGLFASIYAFRLSSKLPDSRGSM
jgi:RecA/RadA recombinase